MKKSMSRHTLAFVALLFLGASLPSSSHAGTFSDSLTNGINPDYYFVNQSATGIYSDTSSSSGIQLAKIQSTSGLQNIVINVNLANLGGNVSGDFSFQIDFANAVIGPNIDQVYLGASFANNAIFQETYDLSSGLNVHVWDGSAVQGAHPVTTNSGTFVISRAGSTVTGSYNGTTIYSNTNTSALIAIYFVLQNQPDAAGDSPSVTFSKFSLTASTAPASSGPAFFSGETALANGVYYLALPNGNPFGYYSYLTNPNYIYHFDLGYEYIFDAADGKGGVFLYDFKSNDFFYTSPNFTFPYLYDFSLNTVLYYYPDPNNAGRYNTNGVRYFYDFATGQIITK